MEVLNLRAASLINAVVPDSGKHGYKYPSSPTAKPSEILPVHDDLKRLSKLDP